MAPKNILHKFEHYANLNLSAQTITPHGQTSLAPKDLQHFRKSFFRAITPLLKHIPHADRVNSLRAAFSVPIIEPHSTRPPHPTAATGVGMWTLIADVSNLFPTIIYQQLSDTIMETQWTGRDVWHRNAWIRKRMLKDLKVCQTRVKRLKDDIVDKICQGEEFERDERLRVFDYVVTQALEEGRKSVKTLIEMMPVSGV